LADLIASKTDQIVKIERKWIGLKGPNYFECLDPKTTDASLRDKHRDGIMRKAARNRPLRASEKRFNKLISKRRFRVEQCFGTMKRLFGLHRARYFGVTKTHAQLAMAAIRQNLLKAANKITLNPQTLAIA